MLGIDRHHHQRLIVGTSIAPDKIKVENASQCIRLLFQPSIGVKLSRTNIVVLLHTKLRHGIPYLIKVLRRALTSLKTRTPDKNANDTRGSPLRN